MQRAGSADDSPVVDGDMSCHLHGVHKNAVVADHAIMRYVNVGHQEAILPDGGFEFVGGPAADGDELAYDGIVTDMRLGFFAGELQILRHGRNRGARIDFHIFSQTCSVPQYDVWTDPASVVYDDISLHSSKRFNDNIVPNLCFRMNVC